MTVAVADDQRVAVPYGAIVRGNLIDEGVTTMSREILEAVREIEREKGIEEDTLVHALEDALLAAYKKTPGASRHAQVELDDKGDFRVWAIELPADIEERLIEEARERAITELEEAEVENGERSRTRSSSTTSLDIDWSEVPDRPGEAHRRHARTTSAASPRRRPSRSSCSGSARPSAR